MDEVIKKIEAMTDRELQEVMRAIERRYAAAHPQWEVIYVAMHRDPLLRAQEYEELLRFIRNASPEEQENRRFKK